MDMLVASVEVGEMGEWGDEGLDAEEWPDAGAMTARRGSAVRGRRVSVVEGAADGARCWSWCSWLCASGEARRREPSESSGFDRMVECGW